MYRGICCHSSGLIIDAFGELRDQLEQVKEDMEVGHLCLWNCLLVYYDPKLDQKF